VRLAEVAGDQIPTTADLGGRVGAVGAGTRGRKRGRFSWAMLEQIGSVAHPQAPGPLAKDKVEPIPGLRLMGFGHSVYKKFDTARPRIISEMCHKVMARLGDILPQPATSAVRVGDAEWRRSRSRTSYLVSRKLYPNVDFYSGVITAPSAFRDDVTVMFRDRRTPWAGWAHWQEMISEPGMRPSAAEHSCYN